MNRMVMATGVLSDAATITGPGGEGDFTIDRLKKQSLQEFYRVAGSSIVLDIDFSTATTIDAVAAIGHNCPATATVQITAGATVGSSTFDTGVLPFITGDKKLDKSLFFYLADVAQTYRYWRIEINSPDSAYIDIGRLYLSKAFQPAYNMVYGFQQGVLDQSQEYETEGGDSIPKKKKKRRFADFILEDLSEDEAIGDLYEQDLVIGTTGDVLFVPKPDELNRFQLISFYGKIETTQPFVHTNWDRFSRQYRIKELLP